MSCIMPDLYVVLSNCLFIFKNIFHKRRAPHSSSFLSVSKMCLLEQRMHRSVCELYMLDI